MRARANLSRRSVRSLPSGAAPGNHRPRSTKGGGGGTPELTHIDDRGRARMVDVGAKPETDRIAVASAEVRMARHTLELVRRGGGPKGDVIGTARLAAVTALKRTADLIPLCHPVRVVGTDVDIRIAQDLPGLRVDVTVRARDRTGVEMEAMVGAAAAALTIYDMLKAVDRRMEILAVRLEEKRGGKSGVWRRDETPAAHRPATVSPGRKRKSKPKT